jgi:hypothetical protein
VPDPAAASLQKSRRRTYGGVALLNDQWVPPGQCAFALAMMPCLKHGVLLATETKVMQFTLAISFAKVQAKQLQIACRALWALQAATVIEERRGGVVVHWISFSPLMDFHRFLRLARGEPGRVFGFGRTARSPGSAHIPTDFMESFLDMAPKMGPGSMAPKLGPCELGSMAPKMGPGFWFLFCARPSCKITRRRRAVAGQFRQSPLRRAAATADTKMAAGRHDDEAKIL